MTSANRLREEELTIRKKLIYDGHGTGEDRRLINLMKNVARLCQSENSNEDISKLYNTITKDLTAAINAAEKNERISQMYDKTFENLDRAIEEKEQYMEKVKSNLVNLKFDLEYEEKLKDVNQYPNCLTTEKIMQDIERNKQELLSKVDKQQQTLAHLIEGCKSLQQVLSAIDDVEDSHERIKNCI